MNINVEAAILLVVFLVCYYGGLYIGEVLKWW